MASRLLPVILTLIALNGCITAHKTNVRSHAASERHINEVQHRDFFDAESARLLGDSHKAINLYKKFVAAYPQNGTAYYILARLQYMNREIAQAEKNGKRACDLNPSNIYFHEFYTQVLLYQNKLKEAEEQYNWLSKNNPENPDYIYSRAMLELRNKHSSKALELLNEYERLTGNNEDISIQRKNILIREGKYQEALREIRKLQENDPHNVEYPLMMVDVYDELKWKDSIASVYESIEKNYKDEPLALVALAQYYLLIKNKEKYDTCLEQVIQNPNLGTESKLALLLPVLRDMDTDSSQMEKEKIVTLTKSLYENSKGKKEPIILYADILFATQHTEEAMKLYKEYLNMDKNQLNPFIQVMSISFDKREYDSVIVYANRCIPHHNNSPYPYFYKGIALSQMHRADSSIACFVQTLKYAQKEELLKSQAWSSMADAYHTMKEYKKSDSCFEEALKLTPDDAGVLNNYAYYLSVRNIELERAEKMSKRSLELQPNTKSFLDTYGWILYQLQKYAEAKTYLEKAEKAEGETDATIYEHIGDVFLKLNDPTKALYYWKQAKDKSENPEELNKKINGLKPNE